MFYGGFYLFFVIVWMLFLVMFCKMGFVVLLVNYCGFMGFGQDSIFFFLGNVGYQDVKDVQFVVEQVFQEEYFDVSYVVFMGGFYGGFIFCYLIGQYLEIYRVCVVWNFVINIVFMLGFIDIFDWCVVEVGFFFLVVIVCQILVCGLRCWINCLLDIFFR